MVPVLYRYGVYRLMFIEAIGLGEALVSYGVIHNQAYNLFFTIQAATAPTTAPISVRPGKLPKLVWRTILTIRKTTTHITIRIAACPTDLNRDLNIESPLMA